MKIIAVCDAFIKEDYYRCVAKKFPWIELTDVIHFGVDDPAKMRNTAYTVERGGSEAVAAPEELYQKIGDAEGLMVHLCPVTRRLIEMAKNLKLIMVNRGGVENINIEAATEKGIAVLSNPAHNANSVAELTVGLMIAESRNIVRAHTVMKNGGWRENYANSGRIFELRGKKVGIIGFGNIGSRVAGLLSAFGCELMFYDPFVPADNPEAVAAGCRKVELNELMKDSDFVTLHARSNDGIIVGKEQFAMMKRDSYFINTARPHLVDYKALYDVLTEGRILGAALDVFTAEPTDPKDPIIKLDNVTLTNHRGGATVNSYCDSPAMIFSEAEKLLSGKTDVKFWVNKSETEKNYKI